VRRFLLIRTEDDSGISGTGVVAEGAELTSGKAVLSWLTPTTSVAIYSSVKDLEAIHGHNGKTRIQWVDGEGRSQAEVDYHRERLARLGF
jgi:hypothetical protein